MDNNTKDLEKPLSLYSGLPEIRRHALAKNVWPLPIITRDEWYPLYPERNKKKFDGNIPLLISDIVERAQHYRRFPRLGLHRGEAQEAAKKAKTYGDFVSALYSRYCRLRGKANGGEKTPDYVRYLLLFHGLFPWVKTVHIIPDGRDVALST